MNDKAYFRDKVVVITGAASGIGRAAALAFARCGAKVVLAARNQERLGALGEEIRRQGGKVPAAAGSGVPNFEDRRQGGR